MHSHYENLKVARDAPIEVIRAAFKALAEKYDPASNADVERAIKVTRIVTTSYEVLSDPVKRAEHDKWLASVERPATPHPEPSTLPRTEQRLIKRITWGGIAVAVLVFAGIFLSGKKQNPLPPSAAQSTTTPAVPEVQVAPPAVPPVRLAPIRKQSEPPVYAAVPRQRYVRPENAPNGAPWPATSGYVGRTGNKDGESELTIDNTQNGSDMLVKLFSRKYNPPAVARILFVRAHDQFVMDGLGAGDYHIHYKNVDTGTIWESDPITIRETETYASRDRITLYQATNGKLRTKIISPEEF